MKKLILFFCMFAVGAELSAQTPQPTQMKNGISPGPRSTSVPLVIGWPDTNWVRAYRDSTVFLIGGLRAAFVNSSGYNLAPNYSYWFPDGSRLGSVGTVNSFDAYNYLARLSDRTINTNRGTFTGGPENTKNFWAPGVGYTGQFFLRDFAMMVRGRPDAFSPTDIMNALAMFASIQQGGGGIPSGIASDGVSIINVTYPAFDNSFEFVDLAYSHYLKTKTTSAFTTYKTVIDNALAYVPITNHLVYTAGTDSTAMGWGFMDVIRNGGYNLMCSAMRYRALKQMATMAAAAGVSDTYTSEANLMPTNLQTYLWDASDSLFKAMTLNNTTQHSVPGSAFAVLQSGLVSASVKVKIVAKLISGLPGGVDYLNSKPISQDGQIRHMPYPEYWDSLYANIDRSYYGVHGFYQNGGYWGTFTGWVAQAIAPTNPTAADKLLTDLVAKYRGYTATLTPPEATNTDIGYAGAAVYCASATLPLEYFVQRLPGIPASNMMGSDINVMPGKLGINISSLAAVSEAAVVNGAIRSTSQANDLTAATGATFDYSGGYGRFAATTLGGNAGMLFYRMEKGGLQEGLAINHAGHWQFNGGTVFGDSASGITVQHASSPYVTTTYTGYAQTIMQSTSTYGAMGTYNNFPLRIWVNNSTAATFATDLSSSFVGGITAPTLTAASASSPYLMASYTAGPQTITQSTSTYGAIGTYNNYPLRIWVNNATAGIFGTDLSLSLVGPTMSITNATNPSIMVTDATSPTTTIMQSTDTYGNVGTYTNHPFRIITNNTTAVTIGTDQSATFGSTVDATGYKTSTVTGYLSSALGAKTAFSPAMYIKNGSDSVQVYKRAVTINGTTVNLVVID